jgi:hypothetical protein
MRKLWILSTLAAALASAPSVATCNAGERESDRYRERGERGERGERESDRYRERSRPSSRPSSASGERESDRERESVRERFDRERANRYNRPMIEFRHYPYGEYDSQGRHNYYRRYYPYDRYRSDIPRDRYDRYKPHNPYPAR